MDQQFPSISVVIPVRNEAKKIAACINGILSQTVPVKEIIVVDSGSTDGTLEILERYELVRVIKIPSSEFNHGLTRKLGVEAVTSEFVLLTVGDAVATNDRWIETLLSGFTDEKVAGVCGLQVIPHDVDKNPIAWYRPVDAPREIRYSFPDPEDFNKLDPDRQREVCGWDDVTALYRREVLLKLPFRKTTFAEDALWAKDALLAGYTLVFNSAATVYHYHSQNEEFTFKKSFTLHYHFFKFFGQRPAIPVVTVRQKLSRVKLLLQAGSIPWTQKWHWYKYNRALDRGTIAAARKFNEAIAAGEAHLDEVHSKLCGTPPIPSKN
jgi:rhamnosyltransferase